MDGKQYLILNKRNARRYPILKKEGYANYININKKYADLIKIFEIKNKHLFSGYYDLDNVSPDGNRMFAISVSKNSVPGINKATINIIDLNDYTINPITSTRAWNWQQGSRIRWIDDSHIMFNDFVGDKYKSVVFDVNLKKAEKEFDFALYDAKFDKNIGLSLNFDLLQLLRPGYGYSNRKYVLQTDIPENDGIYLIDLKTNSNKLIINFDKLVDGLIFEKGKKHYINHISISPDGDKFMFFHLWTKDFLDMWEMRLIVSDMNGNFKVIENKEIISHYTWFNNDKLLVTAVKNGNEKCYYLYDVNTLNRILIENENLVQDGHPTFIDDCHFVTDTYPLENSIQHMFVYDMENKTCFNLIDAFSDPRMYIEKRCDMHPRLHNKKLINIDSTFSDGVRKIVLLKIKQ